MSVFISIVQFLALGFLAVQVATCGIAGWRCRRRSPCRPPKNAPPITLVRPLCGIESHTRKTLEASFRIDYPEFEILFCVARADDPVVPLVQEAISSFPQISARLLIGDDPISSNPKLNNMVKGWRAARFDGVVFADSNLLVPTDYLSRLASTWRKNVGLVSSPPIGRADEGFWGEVECAFLNTYQARWQYVVDTCGFGFAQGKTLFYKRSLLGDSLEGLAAEPAEDAASTKAIRGMGRRIKLAAPPFFQPLGRRKFVEIWSRQIRWARLRRVTFPLLFVPEALTGAVLPLLCAGLAAWGLGLPVIATVALYGFVWYAAEWLMSVVCGWSFSLAAVGAMILRDALIPVLWTQALAGRGYVWQGQAIQAGSNRERSRDRSVAVHRFRALRMSFKAAPMQRDQRSAYAVLVERLPSAGRAGSRVASAMRRMRRPDKPFS